MLRLFLDAALGSDALMLGRRRLPRRDEVRIRHLPRPRREECRHAGRRLQPASAAAGDGATAPGQDGHRVLLAETPAEALTILECQAVDLVISDHELPEMSGTHFLKLVRARWPHAARILLTGTADPAAAIPASGDGEVFRFIRKPWDNALLRVTVHLAFQTLDLQKENRRLEAALLRKDALPREPPASHIPRQGDAMPKPSDELPSSPPPVVRPGGLGSFKPEEVGPIDIQSRNGVVDVRVKDEAEAVTVARRYLGYFQGDVAAFTQADQVLLRDALPERRRRAYKIRPILEVIADTGSVLELRRDFGRSVVTALARLEGRAVGVLASDPMHLGGAIDSDAADKGARFLQLCDAFGLPVISLCDTPGFMVGPAAEKTALVRHVSRLFVAAASLSVPFFTVVLRKGYGLGAQAMAGGHFHAPFFTVSWPTGEFGGMNLEGAVRIGMKKELAAIEDETEREQMFQQMVGLAYERGKATNMASLLEVDAVIDPAETRAWLVRGLLSPRAPRERRRRFVDTW